MKLFFFQLWQWIWGLPQALLGTVICLINRDKPKEIYRGALVTHWNLVGSLGVGNFIFLGTNANRQVLVHEYGHCIQSLILGPLFLPVMGIPSFLWANLPRCKRLRKEKGVSYYAFYPESSANRLGSLVTKEPCNLK